MSKNKQAVKNLVAGLTMIDKDLYSKVQVISKETNISISKIIGKSLSSIVVKYEQKNGEIKKTEMGEKDIEDFI